MVGTTDYVIDEETDRLLEETAKTEEISNYRFIVECGSDKGEGYCGYIKFVDIVGIDKNKIPKTLNAVVKTATKSDAFRNMSAIVEMYKRELYFYNTVLPTYSMFEVQRGLIPSKLAPKIYQGQLKYKNEILIMENLKASGFSLWEQKRPMDEKHMALVMKEYARLHALSFALRDQDPEKYAQLTECVDDLFMKALLDTDFKYAYIDKCRKATETLHKETDLDVIKIYKDFSNTVEDVFLQLLHTNEEYSVVLHGDCWTNNVLFKYKDENDKTNPTELRFLDFQLAKTGSPVLDVSYFFYSCSSEDMINNKLDHFLQIYHNSLAEYLEKLGSDVEKVFPYRVLEEQWRKYGKFGFIMATLMIHLMLSGTTESVDLSESVDSGTDVTEVFNYDLSNMDEYNRRIRSLILHCVKNKFI